jgi:hypothetical protein
MNGNCRNSSADDVDGRRSGGERGCDGSRRDGDSTCPSAGVEGQAMQLPRMTTRRWMIVIAVGAVLLGAETTRQRRVAFRRRATDHARAEKSYRRHLDCYLQKVEEGERLTSRMSPSSRRFVDVSMLTQALAPLGRLADSRPDFEASEARNLPMYRSAVDRFAADVAYHAAMRHKYELASRHPWLSIEPDPPAP